MLRLSLPEDSLHRRVRRISNDHAGSRRCQDGHDRTAWLGRAIPGLPICTNPAPGITTSPFP
jgi:hypothetical protein